MRLVDNKIIDRNFIDKTFENYYKILKMARDIIKSQDFPEQSHGYHISSFSGIGTSDDIKCILRNFKDENHKICIQIPVELFENFDDKSSIKEYSKSLEKEKCLKVYMELKRKYGFE